MRSRWMTAVALVAVAACTRAPTPGPYARCLPTHIVRDGEKLPDCRFEKMGGGSIALADQRGTPLILNFWTSWCPSCIREIPALQRIADAYAGRVQVIGMNGLGQLGETKEDAIEFAEKKGARYPNAYDVDGLLFYHFFGSVGSRPVYPLTLYVDAEGVIRRTSFGEQSEEDLRENIKKYLGIE